MRDEERTSARHIPAPAPQNQASLNIRRHSVSTTSNGERLGSEFQQESPRLQSRASFPTSSQRQLTRSHRKPDIGHASLPGNRYGSVQQDYVVVQELYANGEIPRTGQQCYVVSITDGHGILGDKSALYAGKALARHIFSGFLRNKHLVRMEQRDVFNEIVAAFEQANKAANSVYDHPPRSVNYIAGGGGGQKMATFELKTHENGLKVYREQGKNSEKLLECGCTCTAAVIQGSCVYLADVGDSAAVLGYKDEHEQYKAEVVTVRHNGRNAEEASRIRSKYADMTRILEDGYVQAVSGAWAGYELSVTRALGHKNMEAYGVVAEPYVTMLNLEKKHTCLVLASDGVWDVLQPDEVVHLVMEHSLRGLGASSAAQALVQHAVKLGLEGPHKQQDNTSAIVVFF